MIQQNYAKRGRNDASDGNEGLGSKVGTTPCQGVCLTLHLKYIIKNVKEFVCEEEKSVMRE